MQYQLSQGLTADFDNQYKYLEEQYTLQTEAYQSLSCDHDDLLMLMNDQDEEIAELKNRLRGYGESFPKEDEDEVQD
jgi:hypothetical protein